MGQLLAVRNWSTQCKVIFKLQNRLNLVEATLTYKYYEEKEENTHLGPKWYIWYHLDLFSSLSPHPSPSLLGTIICCCLWCGGILVLLWCWWGGWGLVLCWLRLKAWSWPSPAVGSRGCLRSTTQPRVACGSGFTSQKPEATRLSKVWSRSGLATFCRPQTQTSGPGPANSRHGPGP